MSVNYHGKCDNCGKGNQRVTIEVHIHDILGTKGSEVWCLQCVQGSRAIEPGGKRGRAKSREVKEINA